MEKYFTRVLEKHALEQPEHIAYEYHGVKVTWQEFHKDINRITNSFMDLGLRKGDRIATILPQTPAYISIFMAAANMGLILIPFDIRYKSSEMVKLCRRTSPKLLVTLVNETLGETVKSLLSQYQFEYVYTYGDTLPHDVAVPYERLLQNVDTEISDDLRPTLDDPFIVIFTSGSTGVPKGAVITHKNTLMMVQTTTKTWNITHEDKILLNLPTNHVGGTHDQIATQVYAGATGIIKDSFDAEKMLTFIDQHQITVVGGVPTMFRLIFQKANDIQLKNPSLKLVILGGERAEEKLIYKILESFPGVNVVKSWGMTEPTGFFTYTPLNETVDLIAKTEGVVGADYQLRIVKSDGEIANTNESGEIIVKGDVVIKTYLDEEHNQDVFVDGWLRTGDLGYLDENNKLHFVGRIKEMFISGGYNVYPTEIEHYLNLHPKVKSSYIVGVPDEIWGEIGLAFIAPEQNAQLTVEEIVQFCKKGLANYKIPKKIIIKQDLPMTSVGKIAKQEIKRNLNSYV
jgi:long-chain acyl-CoA synthetase